MQPLWPPAAPAGGVAARRGCSDPRDYVFVQDCLELRLGHLDGSRARAPHALAPALSRASDGRGEGDAATAAAARPPRAARPDVTPRPCALERRHGPRTPTSPPRGGPHPDGVHARFRPCVASHPPSSLPRAGPPRAALPSSETALPAPKGYRHALDRNGPSRSRPRFALHASTGLDSSCSARTSRHIRPTSPPPPSFFKL